MTYHHIYMVVVRVWAAQQEHKNRRTRKEGEQPVSESVGQARRELDLADKIFKKVVLES